MEAHGYETVPTRNGNEVLDLARNEKPDLILMDIALPGIDGIQAFKAIRAVPGLDFAGEQGIVHHEGHGAAAFEHVEGFAVVLGGNHVHLHLLVGVHRLEQALGP